jgi:hypothetical protein
VRNIYIVNETGTTDAMERVHCKDEIRELQNILERNHDLLPGDQINPEAPCRWMLIKREMPVPDATGGAGRWSLDFFFVDQNAMPTFVECKRFDDTRSRREVVGQVLEYAANGPYFWTRDILREHAEGSAKARGSTLEEALRTLEPEGTDSLEDFFNKMEENLKNSQIRIVFFLEEAPNELKCLVEFLNEQMLSSEVLLVEAHQYMGAGVKVIVPTLFGFTEQARRVKQTVTISSRKTRTWNWESFKADAQAKGLDQAAVDAIHELLGSHAVFGCEIVWGGGGSIGSFGLKWPDISSSSAILVWSNGTLQIAFGALNTSETAQNFREKLAHLIAVELGLPVPEDYRKRWVSYPISVWGKNARLLVELLKGVASNLNFKR